MPRSFHLLNPKTWHASCELHVRDSRTRAAKRALPYLPPYVCETDLPFLVSVPPVPFWLQIQADAISEKKMVLSSLEGAAAST